MSIVERAIAKAVARERGEKAEKPAAVDARPLHQPPASSAAVTVERYAVDAARMIDIRMDLLRASGLAPATGMDQRIAEELRVVKRPLLLNAEGNPAPIENGNLVMIGSALPGSGKTFLSLNLALSMASELDWTVLLVDADVSRATLSRGLGLAEAPGLVDLLEHEHGDVTDYVYKTSHPALHFLPAGPPRPQIRELLGSQRMRTLVADLVGRHQRQIVLLDSPPLLLTSEARVLASYAGQIVLVVEAGVTPRRSVLDAIEILDPSKAINLVLNKGRQMFGIGDYDYAGYGVYGEDVASPPAVKPES
jgi:protein-tyrosine kinase